MYDREWPVTDKDGDRMLFGLRGPLVGVDVEQENGLLWFTLEGFGEFVAAATETYLEAERRAAGVPGEPVG